MSTVKMSEKGATKAIAELLEQANKFILSAEKIADKTGVDFYWSGPDYGMGGNYTPKNTEDADWEHSSCSGGESGWKSSSNNC